MESNVNEDLMLSQGMDLSKYAWMTASFYKTVAGCINR